MSARLEPLRRALDQAVAAGFNVVRGPHDVISIAAPDGTRGLILLPPRVARHDPLSLAATVGRFTAAAQRKRARGASQTA